MVNNEIGMYSRADLSLTLSASLYSFLGLSSVDLFDPQIQWDEEGQRYLFAMALVTSGGYPNLVVGWSKGADPTDLNANGTGDWCTLYTSLGNLEDYPKLGHNDTDIIIGTNVFDSNEDFLTSRIWAFDKPANGETTCPANGQASYWGTANAPLATGDDGQYAFTPVPANTFGASAHGYVVAADSGTGESELTVWDVTRVDDTPTLLPLGDIPVDGYGVPKNVPQPGSSRLIDSSDGRLTQAVAMLDPDAGALAIWTQHSIAASNNRSRVRWYEIVPTALNPLRQQGNIDRPGLFAFNGAISPTTAGNTAIIHYNVGSSTQRVQIRAQSRTSVSALGTMAAEVTIGTSVDYDRDFTCTAATPCRWGDYAGASPDPIDSTLVWGSNQMVGKYSGTTDPHWVTRNFALNATVLPTDTTAPVMAVPQRQIGWFYSPTMVGMTVSWAPASDVSGIILYELQMKTGTGSFTDVTLEDTTSTSSGVMLTTSATYTFRVRATDGANNVGPWATTTSAHMSTVQENAASVAYTSGWKRASLSGSLGGRVKYASATNATATLTFVGQSVALLSTSYTNRGILSWRIDGGSWQMVDMYWKPIRKRFTAFAMGGLGAGTHKLDVRVTGTKNTLSTGARIDIDAFIVQP